MIFQNYMYSTTLHRNAQPKAVGTKLENLFFLLWIGIL